MWTMEWLTVDAKISESRNHEYTRTTAYDRLISFLLLIFVDGSSFNLCAFVDLCFCHFGQSAAYITAAAEFQTIFFFISRSY